MERLQAPPDAAAGVGDPRRQAGDARPERRYSERMPIMRTRPSRASARSRSARSGFRRDRSRGSEHDLRRGNEHQHQDRRRRTAGRQEERAGCEGADASQSRAGGRGTGRAEPDTRRVRRPAGQAARLRNQAQSVSPTSRCSRSGSTRSSANAVAGATFSEQALGAFGAVQGWGMGVAGQLLLPRVHADRTQGEAAAGCAGRVCDAGSRLGFFGHNAPALVPGTGNTGMQSQDLSSTTIWRSGDADCYLERTVAGINDNSWLVLDLKKQLAAFRVTSAQRGFARRIRLERQGDRPRSGFRHGEGGQIPTAQDHGPRAERAARAGAAANRSRRLEKGPPKNLQLTLDRTVLNLRPGQFVALTGERADLKGVTASEIVTLKEIQHSGGFTTLFFRIARVDPALRSRNRDAERERGTGNARRDRRRSARQRKRRCGTPAIHAQTAAAHLRLLGVGKRRGELAAGARERLAVGRVGATGRPRHPRAKPTSSGSATMARPSVIFGDGEHGARLPSGVENVTATYRSGIGAAGMVGAGRITLMAMRPLGIRSVTNPLRRVRRGGSREPRQRARQCAAHRARDGTRGLAARCRGFRARVRRHWQGARLGGVARRDTYWVHLTVAASVPAPAADGATTALPDYRVDLGSPLGRNLADAIEAFKDPSMRLRLDTYQPIYFDVERQGLHRSALRVGSDVESPAARRARFSASPSIGAASPSRCRWPKCVRVLHSVAGVVFVDVDVLRRFDQTTPELPDGGVLQAEGVAWKDDDSEPGSLAQLLIINPFGIALTRI